MSKYQTNTFRTVLAAGVAAAAMAMAVPAYSAGNNPCQAKNPCSAACKKNPCSPSCGNKVKKAKNPCNPCAAANPCNPCAAANPCNPCAAANPCNPCAVKKKVKN